MFQEDWNDSEDDVTLPEPIQISDCSSQGFGYICGFIARKMGSKYPHLGNKSSDKDKVQSEISTPWIKHLSYGGLTVPSDVFVVACHGFEKEFKSFHDLHKNGMDQNPNVIERMHNILIKAFPSWPEDILLLFVKTRTFIRMKYLNNQLKASGSKSKIRQLKQIGQFQC